MHKYIHTYIYIDVEAFKNSHFYVELKEANATVVTCQNAVESLA